MTIKELIQLDWEHKCKNSSMPPHAVPKTKYNEKNANGLTKCIVDYINLTGHKAWRVNNGGVYRPGFTIDRGHSVIKSKGTYSFNGTKGVADISAKKSIYINNRKIALPVEIEVKYGKDRLSDAQKKMKIEVENVGGVYLIARTFESFVKEWEEIT